MVLAASGAAGTPSPAPGSFFPPRLGALEEGTPQPGQTGEGRFALEMKPPLSPPQGGSSWGSRASSKAGKMTACGRHFEAEIII